MTLQTIYWMDRNDIIQTYYIVLSRGMQVDCNFRYGKGSFYLPMKDTLEHSTL